MDALRDRYPRVAIAHEWLTLGGGSEKVVEAMLSLVPHAEIFTSVYDPDRWGPPIAERPIHPSFLSRLPGARRHYPKLLPLMDAAFRSFDLRGFDLVISSNHACAKNVQAPPGVPHVCYCHTPMRYAWEPSMLRDEPIGRLAGTALSLLLPGIRRRDLEGASRVDRFLANSTHVADRIRKYYRRDSIVVHPPVEVESLLSAPRRPGDAYLVVSRLVPYKHVDLAIAACSRMGRPLTVVGEGRDGERLRTLAGPGVSFRGHVDDDELEDLLSHCKALLFPGEEDFGMVPVEAQAAGAPVIAFGVGGARDSVVEEVTGVFFGEQTIESLMAAIVRFERLSMDPDDARTQAARFEPARFDRELRRAIDLGPESIQPVASGEPERAPV